jgi:CAAX prenyl protease-like protein
MPEMPTPSDARNEPQWLSALVRAEPRLPLMGPYMAYLLLLLLTDILPQSLYHVAVLIHIAVAFWVTWLFRDHYPPLGRPHLIAAIAVGLLAAALWIAGQHWLNGVAIAGRNLGAPLWGKSELHNPHEIFGNGLAFWGHVIVKIGRAITIVPIVEELFWRGFILRAFVSWDRFELVPWGKFTLFAFLGSALLSTLQHPANWGVSIACWMLYNALFYWKKSLLCMMITHGITNLALYTYVVRTGDWQFW